MMLRYIARAVKPIYMARRCSVNHVFSNHLGLTNSSTVLMEARNKRFISHTFDDKKDLKLEQYKLADESNEDDKINDPSLEFNKQSPDRVLGSLERAFERFERRCQLTEMVDEEDFQKLFSFFKVSVNSLDGVNQNLSSLASIILRSCGRLMYDVTPQQREKYLSEVWDFIKTSPIELDITVYNSLIRSMNENHTQIDPEKMLKEITENQLSPDAVTYQRLIHQYCLRGDIDKATVLLERMKELEFNLNENIFASLITGYGMQPKPPALKEIFDLMKSTGVEPNGKTLAAAIQSVIKRINEPGPEEEFKNILALIQNDDIQFSVDDSLDILSALANHKENKTAMDIINCIVQSVGFQPSNKRLLRALFKNGFEEIASSIYWSRKPSDRALAIGTVGNFYIKLMVDTNRSVEFCTRECDKLIAHGYQSKPYHTLYYCAAQIGNMKLVKQALKKIGEESKTTHTMYWPLIAQAKNESELVDVLKNDLTPDMRPNDLLETFTEWIWPKFSENSDRLFELNKELKYNNAILVSSFLRYSVRSGRINEAIDVLTNKIADLHTESLESQTPINNDVNTNVDIHDEEDSFAEESNINSRRVGQSRSIVGSLLNQIAEQTKDPAIVRKAFEVCLIPGQTVDQGMAMPLIKAHLLNDDFNGAVDTFLHLATKYGITPRKGELIKYCLENKEPESLQKIIDVLTKINSQSDALFDLAYCCICVKKLKQAQKILTNPGTRIQPQRIYRTCGYLLGRNRMENLQDFVLLSQNVYGVDQEYLYSILIEGYKKNNDGKGALALYNRMQEDDIQPSKAILLRLAEVLEESNIDVPFQKPILTSSNNKDIVRPNVKNDRRFGGRI